MIIKIANIPNALMHMCVCVCVCVFVYIPVCMLVTYEDPRLFISRQSTL